MYWNIRKFSALLLCLAAVLIMASGCVTTESGADSGTGHSEDVMIDNVITENIKELRQSVEELRRQVITIGYYALDEDIFTQAEAHYRAGVDNYDSDAGTAVQELQLALDGYSALIALAGGSSPADLRIRAELEYARAVSEEISTFYTIVDLRGDLSAEDLARELSARDRDELRVKVQEEDQ